MKRFSPKLAKGMVWVAAAAIWALAFFAWAPWRSALRVGEAEAKYGRDFPDEWKAVGGDHGRFYEVRLGTTEDRPVAYFMLTSLVFGPPLIIFVLGVRKGLR